MHRPAEVAVVGGGFPVAGLVVGVPAGELPVAVLVGFAALFGGVAGLEFWAVSSDVP